MIIREEKTITVRSQVKEQLHHKILIVGGGTAGLTVAAQLRRKGVEDVGVLEPSDKHYYQAAWTLVGAGAYRPEATVRPEEHQIPQGIRWIQDAAEEIDPIKQVVRTREGREVGYDFLVVAAGIQLDWHKIEGLEETLGQNGVSSNYRFDLAPKTWAFMQQLKGGVALFSAPSTPVKCGGAPQKIMYLTADYARRRGFARGLEVVFGSAGTTIFAVPEIKAVLDRVIERYGIDTRFHHELVAVDGHKKEATFELTANHPKVKAAPEAPKPRITIPFDFLHVVPPQSAPDFIKQSPLADPSTPLGWVEVNKHTLQHARFPNVFSLGDASSLPTSKTGAAVRKQAPVLVENLLSVMKGQEPSRQYDGYTSCPLVTAYGKMFLAEFLYDNKWHPTLPINTQKERYDMWLLKKHGLPFMYWNLMLKGQA
ncbi:NAD(P)/FAD-dependent oxidoreductase [Meiothermus hypogaeus]|uniref:Pyridine nucleotide-disulfide oxidoreductase n=2 Tax=Meiothermus hypogaeus TaxID=884155 RepID=A0A511QX62_9DEIN|nr:FAD/NAD(P)-binding oxidoreductase [Meiothermus hypogaeus]RIH79988.1 Sulfide dehydrogenase [flavocytochrome c] flavoprotein chain [Meiothermus hypogaeus]GEM81971.1 pyridine nucleotide-disulfide oxidoreductase [Meiothermus hypogaeus NBRC 106114]GIW35907.1 MAG: pyridine nucleotide-disulfide oxidoreductase [Meiothermus sp.]